MKLRKVLSLFVALVMMVQVLPLSLFANEEAEMVETVEEISAVTETVYVDSSSLADNDELLEGYIEQFFGISDNSGIMLTATYTGEDALSGVALDLYTALKEGIEKIASGEETSSVITVTFSYTFAELGTDNINDAVTAFSAQLSDAFSSAYYYLVADCPYELYWHDKLSGAGCYESEIPISGDSTSFSVSIPYTFAVATGYQGTDSTTVDSSKVSTAQTAAAYAQSIVDGYANSGYSDLELVTLFKTRICNLVSYEYDYDVDYGDIWQLVYVFDKDTSTNVVCEGYSKAFQYLCDLAGIDCITVTGTMSGGTGEGNHMWNVVYIDGVNYLVDVTNSDTGSVGQDGGLFMVCADDADVSSATGYTFTVNNQTITYTYDAETLAMYPEDYLTLGTTEEETTIFNSSYRDGTISLDTSTEDIAVYTLTVPFYGVYVSGDYFNVALPQSLTTSDGVTLPIEYTLTLEYKFYAFEEIFEIDNGKDFFDVYPDFDRDDYWLTSDSWTRTVELNGSDGTGEGVYKQTVYFGDETADYSDVLGGATISRGSYCSINSDQLWIVYHGAQELDSQTITITATVDYSGYSKDVLMSVDEFCSEFDKSLCIEYFNTDDSAIGSYLSWADASTSYSITVYILRKEQNTL